MYHLYRASDVSYVVVSVHYMNVDYAAWVLMHAMSIIDMGGPCLTNLPQVSWEVYHHGSSNT